MGFSIKNFPANRVDVGGQSLIELLVTIGLASILLPALLTGLLASREGRAQQEQRLIAMSLLKEGEEVARSVREKDWNEFSLNGTYHPVVSGTSWSLAIGAETIMGYTRQILVEDVNRDAGGTIVTSGGSPDPSTKKVTVSVSWGTPIPSSVSSTLYLTVKILLKRAPHQVKRDRLTIMISIQSFIWLIFPAMVMQRLVNQNEKNGVNW